MMAKIQVIRPWDVSMPKMVLRIDENEVIIPHHSKVEIDCSEGFHSITAKCGGFSSTKRVNTEGKDTLIIASIIPNWFYCLYLICIAISIVLYITGASSLLVFYFVILLFSPVLLIVSVFRKKSFFRITGK